MKTAREFDIIVFGATGYTGQLVADYLNQRYGKDGELKWALAGRSVEKLTAVAKYTEIPEDQPFILADTEDRESLSAMARRAKVVLTTVGPYQLYGEGVMQACVEAGTDYVDLCGEPSWMRQMIDRYETAAKETGARIVFSCGFDSIPFDLGVYYLEQEAQRQFGEPAHRVKGRVRSMRGGFSGGTVASLQATLAAAAKDAGLVELLRDPFALAPGFKGPPQPLGNEPLYDKAIESWVAPFIMAAINTRNIHRSNFLLGHAYGEDFTYDEMLITGPGEEGEKKAKIMAGMNPLSADGGMKPGEGPSAEEREKGFFDILFVGETKSGKDIRVGVGAKLDPGYGATSRMIVESAVCLATERAEGPGGIFTPAPAMGDALIRRLVDNAGMTFAVESAA